VQMFDNFKTRMMGLPCGRCGEEYDNILSCFPRIPERDGRTDGRTDRIAISISRVSVLTRDKNLPSKFCHNTTSQKALWKLCDHDLMSTTLSDLDRS